MILVTIVKHMPCKPLQVYVLPATFVRVVPILVPHKEVMVPGIGPVAFVLRVIIVIKEVLHLLHVLRATSMKMKAVQVAPLVRIALQGNIVRGLLISTPQVGLPLLLLLLLISG